MKSVTLLKSGASRSGGLEKWARTLSLAFLERGCKVTLLTSGQPPELPKEIEIHSLARSYPMSLLQVRAFDTFCADFLKNHPTDCVFGLDRNSFQTHLRAGNGVHRSYLERRCAVEGRFSRMKHAVNPLHRLLLSLEKKAFEHPELQRLFTNSDMVRKEILTHYAVDPKKISVIHNGVQWQQYAEDFEAWPNVHIRRHHYELLFVGHGFRRKGLERLLRGLYVLGRKDVHLSVIGKDKELAYFRELAQRLQLDVTFRGEVSDIRPFYQQADALAIPSFYDPFANVTVEALAFGLFVISSKHNGGSEVLTGENGAIIEDLMSDVSVAEAIDIALKNPKSIRSSTLIRNSVKGLDFSVQLKRFMELTL